MKNQNDVAECQRCINEITWAKARLALEGQNKQSGHGLVSTKNNMHGVFSGGNREAYFKSILKEIEECSNRQMREALDNYITEQICILQRHGVVYDD